MNGHNMMTKEIVQKISIGDSLTDAELEIALEFYRNLVKSLQVLSPTFDLALREANRVYCQLDSYHYWRTTL